MTHYVCVCKLLHIDIIMTQAYGCSNIVFDMHVDLWAVFVKACGNIIRLHDYMVAHVKLVLNLPKFELCRSERNP